MRNLFENGTIERNVLDHHVSYILNDDSLFYLTGLKAIQNEKNPGILKCVQIKFNGKDKLIYLTENYQNLRDKLPKISEELFLKYAKKFVSIIKALQEESFLKWNHLDVAKESVFVNPMTNDIYLICLPVTDSAIEKTHSDVNQWMKKVLFDWMLFAFSIPEERREFYLQQLSEEGTQVEVIISNYYNKPIQAEKTDEYQKAVKMRLYNQANALEFVVDKEEFILGKSPYRADGQVLGSVFVGNTHCKILKENGTFYVQDMESKNGTFVNSKKLMSGAKELLKSGDVLTLANLSFDIDVIRG